MSDYSVRISEDIGRQLRRCRASFRQSIQKRLQEIVDEATALPVSRRPAAATQGPRLRFYVFEGYGVSYQVDHITRSVTITKLRPAS